MNYMPECKNSHDFIDLLKNYGLTPAEWYKLKYEWDFLDPRDQMEIDNIGINIDSKNIDSKNIEE